MNLDNYIKKIEELSTIDFDRFDENGQVIETWGGMEKRLQETHPELFLEMEDGKLEHRLVAELGVYDNLPIYIKIKENFDKEYKDFIEHFKRNGYNLNYKNLEETCFIHKDNKIHLRIRKKLTPGLVVTSRLAENVLLEKKGKIGKKEQEMIEMVGIHYEFLNNYFDMSFMIHPGSAAGSVPSSWALTIAQPLVEILNYLKDNNYQLSLPNSTGSNYYFDSSRIVYNPKEINPIKK